MIHRVTFEKVWKLLWIFVAPFTNMVLTLILARISNYMPRKVWNEITNPSLNFNGCTVEVYEWIGNFISHIIMGVIIYPCWD